MRLFTPDLLSCQRLWIQETIAEIRPSGILLSSILQKLSAVFILPGKSGTPRIISHNNKALILVKLKLPAPGSKRNIAIKPRRLSENGYFSQSLRQAQIIILEILDCIPVVIIFTFLDLEKTISFSDSLPEAQVSTPNSFNVSFMTFRKP